MMSAADVQVANMQNMIEQQTQELEQRGEEAEEAQQLQYGSAHHQLPAHLPQQPGRTLPPPPPPLPQRVF